MAEQESKTVFWDRHEAALLIDLCLQVHAGKIKRAEGLAQLSARLRHRAKLMGRKIDENFRSAASLANYYAMIEYLITDGLRGEPEAAPILASVYKTFISEPDEFRKILDEAEHQCRKKVFEFDTHEVIKMVEASVKLNTLDNIGEAVNDLAKLLQDYAKKRGVDDSDISRDVSAIAKRINVIDGLRRGRQTDSATPREVFLVKLYKYDPEKFRALLSEANKALGIETHMPPPDIIAEALKTHFPGGFKYASAIAKKQLRHCLDENELRDISDEQLIKALRAITVESNGKLFLPYDEQQSQLVEEIKSTAANILDSGFSCIYVDKLFERFADRLTDLLHFGSATDLMERMGWDKNILTRGVPDINADVQKFFREAGHPISYVELEKAMWFLPFDKLKTAVIASPNIICVKSETYMDIAAFPLKDGDRHKAEQLIKGVLATVPSISIEECRRSIYKEFPEIVNATSDYTTQGFGNVLRGMFGNRFSFNRNMISAASEVVSKRQLFVDFCNERKNFTLDELQAFAEEINSQIEFKSVRRVAVRISTSQFIHRDLVHFDVKAVDEKLNEMIEDCRSIKSISMHFDEFPPIKEVEWNEYVLESYLFGFSEEFELINSVFSKLSWGGAAGRRSLHLAFEDVAEKILAKSKRWKDRESALDLLVSERILLRRAFKDIDEVIRRLRAEEE